MPDKREIPEDAVVVVPVDLFRDIMIVVAGTGRDRELWDKLYDLRWSVPKPDGQPVAAANARRKLARVQERIAAAEERVENLRIRAAYLKTEAQR